MKPLLVGEANPYQSSEEAAMYYALHPDPPRASGGRLCFVIMRLDERTYLRSFDRTDLCFPKWSLPAARAKAAQLVAERGDDDVIVSCGSKVANAFGVPFVAFTIVRGRHADNGIFYPYVDGPRIVVLPHPSGLNRQWHATGAYDRARAVLREAGVLPA